MAIDTAEKRKAVAGIPFHLFLGVTPNVAKDVEWRQEAAWGYPGITPAGAPTGRVRRRTAKGWQRIWFGT